MGLIFCTQCGAQISEQAQSCPKCGNLINSQKCKECGADISANDSSCRACGHPIISNNTVYVKAVDPRKNGMATAGFVLSIIGAALCWVPVAGFLLLLPGLILSLIGMIYGITKKKSYVLGIIGLAISGIFFIVAIVLVSSVGGILGSQHHNFY